MLALTPGYVLAVGNQICKIEPIKIIGTLFVLSNNLL